MSAVLLSTFVIFVHSSPISWTEDIIPNFDEVDHLSVFKEWQQHFNKQYEDTKEENHRFLIFVDNWKRINDHNVAAKDNYTMGLNQFGDLTHTEFLYHVHGHAESCLKHRDDAVYKMDAYKSDTDKPAADIVPKVPESLDWTNINGSSYVAPVKDQGTKSIYFHIDFRSKKIIEKNHSMKYFIDSLTHRDQGVVVRAGPSPQWDH